MASSEIISLGKAWVIFREGTSHPMEVLALLSVRTSADEVKSRLEWLYGLTHYTPSEQVEAARYNKPQILFEANFIDRNTKSAIHCGANPYLVAHAARRVELHLGTVPILHWQVPDLVTFDNRGVAPPTRQEGAMTSAPYRCPFRENVK